MLSGFRRWHDDACAPLVLLTGCPQQQVAHRAVPAQATAPAIAAPRRRRHLLRTRRRRRPHELAARARKAQQLIDQAEGDYRSGVDNYRGGRLEAARSDFDMAVDLMLTSGMDLKSDPQLSDEFEHLLNAINSLEMSALKQGNGLLARRSRRRRSMPPTRSPSRPTRR